MTQDTLDTFDLTIIGSGPGGYVAAIRAAQLGLKTALIEEKELGGICLNWGCIPTKALLRSSEVFHLVHHADTFGVKAEKVTFDVTKMVTRSREVSSQLSKGVQHLLKKNKVTVLKGRGKLLPKKEGKFLIELSQDKTLSLVRSTHVILATGARARTIPGITVEGRIWTYRQAMMPTSIPKSLLIIGSGAIGIEFASFYKTLGSQVTVIEAMDRILPVEDREISTLARKSFEAQGMQIITDASLQTLTQDQKSITAVIKNKDGSEQTLTAENAILAIGIVGNTENLGLENTSAQVDKTHIIVDDVCQTHEPGLYAIGDVAGAPWLAHKASHEGVMVANHLAGKPVHKIHTPAVPGCTYSHPQIASIGLTEDQAKEKGYTVKVGRFPYLGNGKAIALGESEGLIKTLFDEKTGALLGAHMIGAEVTELIQGYALAMTCEATEAEIMNTIFPHPTLSEMMHESALQAFEQAIHI